MAMGNEENRLHIRRHHVRIATGANYYDFSLHLRTLFSRAFCISRQSIFVDNYTPLSTCQNELRAACVCFGVGVPATDADGSRGF